MLFFHPVVWYTNSQIWLLRECLCDDQVLSSHKISVKNYGAGLLSILKLNLVGPYYSSLLPAFGSERKKLAYRIQNLKGGRIMGKWRKLLIYVSLLLLGLFLLPMAGRTVGSQKNVPQTSKTSVKEELQKKVPVATTKPENTLQNYFIKPVHGGQIKLRFGLHDEVEYYKGPDSTQKASRVKYHRGIDIALDSAGKAVYAAADGKH